MKQIRDTGSSPHFLVATFPLQGHINPGRLLAKKIANITGARVTFCTSLSGHRRMFGYQLKTPDQEVEDGLITYMPFSDGYDDGFPEEAVEDPAVIWGKFKSAGTKNMGVLMNTLAARGRPVTCAIYTMLLSWVADVARDSGIPSVHYWIQPAAVFASYYHFFHGYDGVIHSHASEPLFPLELPGLPPMQIRDVPSFLTITDTSDPYFIEVIQFRELFETLDREAVMEKSFNVLLNTFDELEWEAVSAIGGLDLVPIGPIMHSPLNSTNGDTKYGSLFKEDDKDKYVEWLDSKLDGSVVYISFGSLTMLSKQQLHEISQGITGRPFLWVVREDNRKEAGVEMHQLVGDGMVVEWCSQPEVLSHPAVGCFVTHCGWNSTLESLMAGVPMVCVPQMSDQNTIAKLVAGPWGAGVRAEVGRSGFLEGAELNRCLDLVMADDNLGALIRRRTALWRQCAIGASSDGGSSYSNLTAFIQQASR